MSLGLVGRKVGMMRIFTNDGDSIPVTVLDVSNNRVTQIKTVDNDGYSAVQVTYGTRRASRVAKPQAGHFAKAGVEAGSVLREFKVDEAGLGELKPGAVVSVEIFQAGQKVDVAGTSHGKGFAGTIKRHNFKRGPMTHGSMNIRRPGSIGQSASPSRVLKGTKSSGHMGDARVTLRGLTVAKVDAENNLIMVKGSVPGPNGGLVVVKKSERQRNNG